MPGFFTMVQAEWIIDDTCLVCLGFSYAYVSGGAVPDLWASGEPNGAMDCTGLLTTNSQKGKWVDTGCLTNSKRGGRGFVCERGDLKTKILFPRLT